MHQPKVDSHKPAPKTERARFQELESVNLTLIRLSTLTDTQLPGENLVQFSLKSMGVEILAFHSQRLLAQTKIS